MYEIRSPETTDYNCIARAADEDERWWWPDPMEQYYWPEGIERRRTLDAFVQVYNLLGYELCENGEQESDYQKIAIFVNELNLPTHAARQNKDGNWTSKVGSYEDIVHLPLEAVNVFLYERDGDTYGRVAVFMRRKLGDE